MCGPPTDSPDAANDAPLFKGLAAVDGFALPWTEAAL